ncbi:hypothetical protein [Streptomyces sp. NPDC006668]|uniref:hypothetical protein n=1 Tax=Streptomyces sp. NPDC006668 TaxID=3156903 RepID=UPI0033C14E6B
MFRRDPHTGEEIAHRITTPSGYPAITMHADFHRQTPGADVEEVRGHSAPQGFVVERVIDSA